RKTFRTGCGPNFHPTFVVCMTTNPERMTLVLQDQHCTAVWEHGLCIPSPSSRKISADGTLEKPKSLKRKLFNILKDLKDENFKNFKWYLEDESLDSSSPIQKAELENADRQDVVELVVHRFGCEGALKVTEKVLKDIGMNNLVEELQNPRFH
ncbi:hypothetical protein ATANTOWER_020223, partial [Ataeniobius toweri]|nr:hypothetical protein [Ataeniobius toweri]